MKNVLMTKALIHRVMRELIVDTRKYRYKFDSNNGQIRRIPLEYLDTTAALTEWETVADLAEAATV
jgi:hypothetical protein